MKNQPITREKALLYRLDAGTEKGDGIRRILRAMNVAVVDLTPDMLGQTVGACFGLTGFRRTDARHAGEVPTDDVLVMAGFSDSRIQHLLGQIRAAGLPRIGLMATVTAHNRDWTMAFLINELSCERRIMGAWMNLQKTVKAVEAMQAGRDANMESPDSGIEQALAAAHRILGSEEQPELEAIRQADAGLRVFLPGHGMPAESADPAGNRDT